MLSLSTTSIRSTTACTVKLIFFVSSVGSGWKLLREVQGEERPPVFVVVDRTVNLLYTVIKDYYFFRTPYNDDHP